MSGTIASAPHCSADLLTVFARVGVGVQSHGLDAAYAITLSFGTAVAPD
jgi:hypothetical protein